MFSKPSTTLSNPPQDVIYLILVNYKYEKSQIDEFRKRSALYGALTNPKTQQFLTKETPEEHNHLSNLYEVELGKAKAFLLQQSLTATEKQDAEKAFETIAAEINEKKNNLGLGRP